MAQTNQKKGKGGGGADASAEAEFLPNFVSRLAGNAINILRRRGFDTSTGDSRTLTTAFAKLVQGQGTLRQLGIDAVAAGLIAGTNKLADEHKIPTGVMMVLREVLDEAFDDLGNAYAGGRLTHADANKVVQEMSQKLEKRLDEEMSFDWALQFLTNEQRTTIMEMIVTFRQNEVNKNDWDSFWRLKLNKPNLLTPLIQVGVARWREHLEGIFGKPPGGGGKKATGMFAGFSLQSIIDLFTGAKRDERVAKKAREATRQFRRGESRAKRAADALAALRGK